ncbi:C4-dicarboxylate ABC transporter substrate-binding protein [Jeotgalibacillus malaysiensis]|uniref:C4-dicarboxylate ABC transporter substrate-binding protein n=1 Tax=Jeotgalibacillus malaysiensis TaxID=1508404 RepID=A0A0B5AR79_9BACL|nr:TRAP transporter substrate-binding protein [Jeotgalibacillus malaysiensis]AJD92745.1 C4-dicarboxylate ABC transporter substrate-binding protein [Jeotgalibacillus malaysiensis]
MKKLKLVGATMLIGSVAALSACGSEDSAGGSGEAEYQWKLGWNSGEEGDSKGEAAIAFKEYVEAESDGRIEIEFFPNETYASSPEMIEAVQVGALEMAIPGANELANVVPEYAALSLPFIVETAEEAHAVLDSDIGTELREKATDQGFVALTDTELGFTHITNDVRPINEPSDLEGLSMRSPNDVSLIETFKAFGSSVSTMAYTELYSGLSQGVIDGQFNPLLNIFDQNMHEVQDYLAMTNFTYYYCYMILNQDVFNSLDEDLQQIVMEGAEKARDASREVVAESEQEYFERAQEEFVEVTEPDLAAFQEAAQPVYKEVEDVMGEEIIQDIQSFLEEYRQ